MHFGSSTSKFGRYKILAKIGLGGMAEVFCAETSSEKRVAIKKILPSFTSHPKFVSMFLDEAKIVISLKHPNIVEIYDFGKINDVYFLAMEWIDGKPLANLIRRQHDRQIIFPPGVAVLIAMEIACGLDYAHKKKDAFNNPYGIVHRDISPPNILVSWDGEVKITDFGIAKAANKVSITKPGILKGKFSYMSPEQARAEEIDLKSDVFSLGIVLYEMVTGIRLFLRAREQETIEAVKYAEIRPPKVYNPQIPDLLENVVMKALDRNPKRRYQDCEEFGDALEEVLSKHYPNVKRETVASLMQFLYPETKVFKDDDKKQQSILFWSQETKGDSAIINEVDTRIERSNKSLFLKLGAAVLLLAAAFAALRYGIFGKLVAMLGRLF